MKHRWSTTLFGIVILSSLSGCADHSQPLEQPLAASPVNSGSLGVGSEQADGESSVMVNDRLNRKVRHQQ